MPRKRIRSGKAACSAITDVRGVGDTVTTVILRFATGTSDGLVTARAVATTLSPGVSNRILMEDGGALLTEASQFVSVETGGVASHATDIGAWEYHTAATVDVGAWELRLAS